jgi:hypothetical protein
LLTAAAVAVFAVAGMAAAGPGPGSITLATATPFTATTVSHADTHTCQGANGDTINVTDATLTGTSTAGDAHLAGPVTIHVKSVYDTNTNVGTLKGDIGIAGTSTTPPGHFHAKLSAVDVNGTLNGWLDGDAGGGLHFTSGFTGTYVIPGGTTSPAGFTAGVIAGNSVNNAGVFTSGGCAPTKPAHPTPPPHPKPPTPKHDDHGHGHH